MLNVRVTFGAGLKFSSPPCCATIAQLPALIKVTVLPAIEHAPVRGVRRHGQWAHLGTIDPVQNQQR